MIDAAHCLNLDFYKRKLSATFAACFASVTICKNDKWQRNWHYTKDFFLRKSLTGLEPSPLDELETEKKNLWLQGGLNLGLSDLKR